MRNIIFGLAVGALILGAFASATPAFAAFSFEDPQLCVDGKLLRVDPTTAKVEVWVRVGPDVQVDYNVANCGGNPDLPVVAKSHVKKNGDAEYVEVKIKTKKWTDVVLEWAGSSSVLNSGKASTILVRLDLN